ncbi:hypothetical protein M430DRAFT_27334 [Amorphotheca resinae ATCC 22711]|uniref:Uncharacterized protein n=1 Tax=Amorphotheca resinae ATCC 22711 TaxID=857342 RepID=A0A2T3B3P4_AMORE|nr:hypothetical protein M430DRAFT_27334 [Amorphotheca resinae ATCC 22711]PSS20272.1 hypothetical protein M430DRAFT_27334 [Amorphotheca resinae ATCC 22711]
MQFSSICLVALTAVAVSAQDTTFTKKNAKTATDSAGQVAGTGGARINSANSTKPTGAGGKHGSSTASTTGKKMNSSTPSSTSSSGTAKSTTNAAAGSLLSNGGGLVTVAGLGIMFAVFM